MAKKENGDSTATIEGAKEELLKIQRFLNIRTSSNIDMVSVQVQKVYDMLSEVQSQMEEIKGHKWM